MLIRVTFQAMASVTQAHIPCLYRLLFLYFGPLSCRRIFFSNNIVGHGDVSQWSSTLALAICHTRPVAADPARRLMFPGCYIRTGYSCEICLDLITTRKAGRAQFRCLLSGAQVNRKEDYLSRLMILWSHWSPTAPVSQIHSSLLRFSMASDPVCSHKGLTIHSTEYVKVSPQLG